MSLLKEELQVQRFRTMRQRRLGTTVPAHMALSLGLQRESTELIRQNVRQQGSLLKVAMESAEYQGVIAKAMKNFLKLAKAANGK